MTNYLKKLIPFFIITILAAGGVETFYRMTFTRLLQKGSAPAKQEPVQKVANPPVNAPKGQTDYQTIVKRNLFGSSTKEVKAATEVAVPAQITVTSAELTLLGTIAGLPNNRRAIILDKKKKAQDIYYQGDAIQGAVIKEIQRGKVILTINGKDEILIPETPKAAAAGASNPGLSSPPSPPPEIPQETPPEPEIPPETPPEMQAEMTPEPPPVIPGEPVIESPEPIIPNAGEANNGPSPRRHPNIPSPPNKNNTPETP